MVVAVSNAQNKRAQEQLEESYRTKIEASIKTFKKNYAKSVAAKYGQEYANMSFDVEYVLLVYDSGDISLSYYIEGDKVLEYYSDIKQKELCNGCYDLFSDLGTYNVEGKVYINDSLKVRFNDLYEEAEEVGKNRNTCKFYACYETYTRPSGYCATHDAPGWKMN